MIPTRYKVDFAKCRGEVPFPCHYCQYNLSGLEYKVDEHNIVKEFGIEANIPQTCGAGCHGPSEHGDCRYMIPKALPSDYTRWYPSSLFEFFSKDYAMEMITDIKANRYISRTMLIARALKGYHTREQRIKELVDMGIVDVFYNIDNEETYSLTDYGQQIADAITDMLDRYLIIKEHGELMAYEPVKQVFEYIRDNPDCTSKQIYDYFDANYDYDETLIPNVLENLILAEYVEPMYDSDYSNIGHSVTHKGLLRWGVMYNDN